MKKKKVYVQSQILADRNDIDSLRGTHRGAFTILARWSVRAWQYPEIMCARRSIEYHYQQISLQETDDTAGYAVACRSGLETLVGSAATEVVGFFVDHQGPPDRASDTHQAQVMVHTVDTCHSVLPDLDIAEITDVT